MNASKQNSKWVLRKQARADRIPEVEWKRHKDYLCRLYEQHTLKAVIDIMAKEHRFEPRCAVLIQPHNHTSIDGPSERQLNYKFEQWGRNKYGKRLCPKQDTHSESSLQQTEFPDPFAASSDCKSSEESSEESGYVQENYLLWEDDWSTRLFNEPSSILPGETLEPTSVKSPSIKGKSTSSNSQDGSNRSDAPSWTCHEHIDRTLDMDRFADYHQESKLETGSPLLPKTEISTPKPQSSHRGYPQEVMNQDLLLDSLEDCRLISESSVDSPDALRTDLSTPNPAGPLEIESYQLDANNFKASSAHLPLPPLTASLPLACMKSQSPPYNADFLTDDQAHLDSPNFIEPFGATAFGISSHGAHTFGLSDASHEHEFFQSANDGLRNVRRSDTLLSSDSGYSSDSRFRMKTDASLSSCHSKSSLSSHVYSSPEGYHTTLFSSPVSKPSYTEQEPIVRRCLRWTQEQIQSGLVIPDQIRDFPRTIEQSGYFDDIQLFCTLWSALVQALRQDMVPCWASKSKILMGLSSVELLVNVSLVISDESKAIAFVPGSSKDPSSLLRRAEKALNTINSWDDRRLWKAFHDKSQERACPREPHLPALSLKSQLLDFVSKTLGREGPQMPPWDDSASQTRGTNHTFSNLPTMDWISESSPTSDYWIAAGSMIPTDVNSVSPMGNLVPEYQCSLDDYVVSEQSFQKLTSHQNLKGNFCTLGQEMLQTQSRHSDPGNIHMSCLDSNDLTAFPFVPSSLEWGA